MSSPAPRKFPCHIRLTAAGNAWHRRGGCRGAALPHQRMTTGGSSDRPHVGHAHWTKEQHVTFVARVLGVQADKSCVVEWASIIVHVQIHGHTISGTTDMGATHIVSRSWCVSGSYVSNVAFFHVPTTGGHCHKFECGICITQRRSMHHNATTKN